MILPPLTLVGLRQADPKFIAHWPSAIEMLRVRNTSFDLLNAVIIHVPSPTESVDLLGRDVDF